MKNTIIKTEQESLFEKKIRSLQETIHKTILSAQKYKILDILGPNELSICISTLENLFNQLNHILESIKKKVLINKSEISNKITEVMSELIIIFKNFGTESFYELVSLIIGNDYVNEHFSDIPLIDKFYIINRYVHPINFKFTMWRDEKYKSEGDGKKILQKNRLIEDSMICENSENLECYDLARTSKSFQTKVYGIKIAVHDYKNKKTYIISCVVDDILLSCFNNKFIQNRIRNLNDERPNDNDFVVDYWQKFVNSLTLKELMVYNNSELYNKFQGIINQLQLIKQKTISQIVKEFINNDLYGQRTLLIQLLIKSSHHEFQYLSYLLYDLLSNENNGNVDTMEQTILYDSLPWNIKKSFRDAMKQTIQYTNNLSNFDNNKIPLEQQICLLKAEDSVKEKAILKLKEIKAKSEDSGTKARQYLDGLLKIPFGIYKEEHILTVISETQIIFKNIYSKIKITNQIYNSSVNLVGKDKYTNIELLKFIKEIEDKYLIDINNYSVTQLINNIKLLKRDRLICINNCINNLIKINKLEDKKLVQSNRKNGELQLKISEFIDLHKCDNNIINGIYNSCVTFLSCNNHIEYTNNLMDDLGLIKKNINEVTGYIENVNRTLNKAIYGHDKAKRQIERIVGQWINGEKTGYCFGFEGPPGVGKTSLAKKGISHCLKDHNGESRPFAFIAVGGSSNGSTLEGHNYTYVGSTWGRIVDILIETKCMNPIIFIDELDKISRTEHGKELIGILTHLIDPTQNDTFQDKYFTGIDLNLSKALFIFSYNDVDYIDRILLDRIHRIKFKHLSLSEKLIITKDYILPEIYEKMGLDNIIVIEDNIIEFVINTYTNEPGVRKLKELFFEIIGEINLSLLITTEITYTFPIIITIEDLKYKYLKDRIEHKIKKVNTDDMIGIVNGLWANSVGQGGLLPIEAKIVPASGFLDLQLTGMQGDVMKESMTVAKTLAWSLLENDIKNERLKAFEKNKCQGIHIHVPEGATPKDGPSGGAAITIVIYSLLSEKKIKKNIAMTGEICLQGRITAIGGLDLKIMGGLKSGATEFIYPKENKKDYEDFYENLKDKSILDGIKFYEVEDILEVFKLIFIE